MIDESDLENLLVCRNCGNVYSQVYSTYCPACEEWPEGAKQRADAAAQLRARESFLGGGEG